MKIIPAILAENLDDFIVRMRQAELFTDYVQIDLMDGVFVPTSQGFHENKLNDIETSLSFEIHLMVKHPFAYMGRIFNPHLRKVIFHFESDVKHLEFIDQMKKRGLDVGMAIKPETEIKEFNEMAQHVNSLIFLTVDPCCYGNPFRPEVIDKIRKTRNIFKDKIISADGGASLENLPLFLEAGVDSVCVGSRIFLGGNPKENYIMFIKKLAELEASK
jgi:ribulose-phosphate 3-epimerase